MNSLDAFITYTDGERVQYRPVDTNDKTWYDIGEFTNLGIFSNELKCEFRSKPKYKPKLVTVEILEFGFVPSIGQQYFYTLCKDGVYCVDSKFYTNCVADRRLTESGVYETQQGAMTLADALNKLKGKINESYKI